MTLTSWSDDFLRGQLASSLVVVVDGDTLTPTAGLLMTLLWTEALRRGLDIGPVAEEAPLERAAGRWAS